MERKRIEKLVALLLIGILIPVSLFPFPIKADSFEWYRVTGELMSSELINEVTINNTIVYEYLFNYQYKVKFDDKYLGMAQIRITQEYLEDVDNNGAIAIDTSKTYTTPYKYYFVNSDEVILNLSLRVRLSSAHQQTNYDPCKNFTPSVGVTNANVTKIGLLTSIDEIIDILSNIYTSVDDIEGLSTNQLAELANIVSNTSLANDYLELISKLRQYNIPMESFYPVSYALGTLDDYLINDVYYLTYPIFDIPSNTLILRHSIGIGNSYYFIFGINKIITSGNISNYINSTNSNISLSIVQQYGTTFTWQGEYFRFYLIEVKNSASSGSSASGGIRVLEDSLYVPIYYGAKSSTRFSTEFALIWGLSNPLLSNIEIIANGTTQSNSASASLDQTTSQFSDDANDLVTIEESFNDSMNDSLENVSPVFNMGSSFLTSANWVSQQFNRIVNNTPFASLITFGLTLGLGLLIIGKVRK